MLKTLTVDGITLKMDDGERLDKSFFMDGCFDASLNYKYPSIMKVVINHPATIVFWSDGTKTVVKCAKNERFDAEKGVAMAIAKKFLPKQYGKKLTAMTDEALSKCLEAQWKANKKKQKKETKVKRCSDCKYEHVSVCDPPCRNCCTARDLSKSGWVPKETEKKACWNCKFKSLSFWDHPCKSCRSARDRSEWVPEEKNGR